MTHKEPTQDMIDAGNAAMEDMTARNKVGMGGEVVVAIYKAMQEADEGSHSKSVHANKQAAPSVVNNPVPKETQTKSKAANAPEVDVTIHKAAGLMNTGKKPTTRGRSGG